LKKLSKNLQNWKEKICFMTVFQLRLNLRTPNLHELVWMTTLLLTPLGSVGARP
jgi:hypothetical protein